jgi:hypothetical protein
MTYPVFASGDVLNASDMNGVGLWLVKSQMVGTGVSSVTVTGAFSADYDNYKIIYSGGQSSMAVNLSLQLAVGGTVSSTAYFGALVWVNRSTGAVAGATDNNSAQFAFAGGAAGANDGAVSLNCDLLNPFLTKRTRIHNAQVAYDVVYGTYTGLHDLGTSYDGFKITPGAGTLTGGTIRVYGYRN